MFRVNKLKILVRKARIEDIPQILEVEKAAWGKERAATFEMFRSRIKTFPEGILLALINKKMAGVIVTQIVNYNFKKNIPSWYEATDNGFITKTHNPNGDTLYGVDLSVNPKYQDMGVGKKLMESVGKLAIRYNLKQGVLGGRIPNYYKFADKISVEDYINIDEQKGKNNIPPDPELIFYRKEYFGIKIVKIMPNYFKDPESLNYGVLLVWKNPFYNKWYRHIVARLFKI
ncbi:MAG: GNAT family N-acetyltransferase [Candidatus Nealsonbacteria bacterium]